MQKCFGFFGAIIAVLVGAILYFSLQCCCYCWYRKNSDYNPLSGKATSDPAPEAATIGHGDRDDMTQRIGSMSITASEISSDHMDTDRFNGGSFQKRTVERTEQERRERGTCVRT